MNTTIPMRSLTPKLTWRESELLSLLQARGPTWIPETKLARVSLKFEALVHRLRARGIGIQRFVPILGGARFYRLSPPKPVRLA